ncbi:hypothetical protein DL768_009447 [Monosporascus sp. mg162]|nr:hypothetical protein DL768_009447 [Monosporascus sp. mg162]
MANTRDAEMWLEGILAKYDPAPNQKPFGRDEFDKLLGHCEAVCDMPANIFGEELIEAYPDAKVVLVERHIESWYKSFNESVIEASFSPLMAFLSTFRSARFKRPYLLTTSWFKYTFRAQSKEELRANAREVYRKHYETIRQATPANRLLEYDLKQGWEPLCNFLGKPIPDVPFPYVNDRDAFREKISILVDRWVRDFLLAVNSPKHQRAAVYAVAKILYNIFLHPLRSFPGPFLYRASPIPRCYCLLRGELTFRVAELHAKYGPIVRIGPDELAFSDPQAWRDIYGHRARAPGSISGGEFAKYGGFYRPVHGTPPNIISARRDEHVVLRRQLAPGFSDRYMKAQEPIIGAYVDLLVRRLRENCAGGKPLNMHWATFDIIGDLGFGSSFGCLEDSGYHPWVRNITDNFRHIAYMQVMIALGLQPIIQWAVKSGIMKKRRAHDHFVAAKVSQRMELGAERHDLIEGLINKKDELFSGSEEDRFSILRINAGTLIIAGSETTATLLSGAVYLLTTNPDKLSKLAREVRDKFASDDEITLLSVNDLPYMLACLNESLRLYPPVAVGNPRQVPRGGASVLGKFIPENTVVAVWHWAISRDPNFWSEPHTFHPERFMGDPKFKNDHLDAMQPFSYGPRDCIGRSLAYAEMRLILSKIIWHFDMVIDDGSRRWLPDQKAYILWDKPDLNVYLTPVHR